MARLSDSITYGNHAITGDADVGGTLTIGGVIYNHFDPSGTYSGLRAQATTKGDVGLGSVDNIASNTGNVSSTNAQRNSSGDIRARLFRPEYTTLNTGNNVNYFWTSIETGTNNNYLRPTTTAEVKNVLGVISPTSTSTSTNKTLVANEKCFVTAGGLTITLPATPAETTTVSIGVQDFTNTTVARNGQNIMGLAENLTIDSANTVVTLFFANATEGWRII